MAVAAARMEILSRVRYAAAAMAAATLAFAAPAVVTATAAVLAGATGAAIQPIEASDAAAIAAVLAFAAGGEVGPSPAGGSASLLPAEQGEQPAGHAADKGLHHLPPRRGGKYLGQVVEALAVHVRVP